MEGNKKRKLRKEDGEKSRKGKKKLWNERKNSTAGKG